MSGSNTRANRLRRWLGSLPAGTLTVAVEVMRGEQWEPLNVVAAEAVDERAAELGEGLSASLQDEADARGGNALVVARAAAYAGGREPVATISMRAKPSEEAEDLGDASYDGTAQGQISQLQQHVQALIRLSVEKDMATARATRQVLEMQGQVIERLLARHDVEVQRSDELREAIVELAPAWTEVLKAAPVLLPVIEPLLKRLGAGKKKTQAKDGETSDSGEG